jgi:hypothetical protein
MNNTLMSFFNRIFSNRRSAFLEAPESKEPPDDGTIRAHNIAVVIK